jgi:hypothetical protein
MPGICQTALAAIAELRKDHGIEVTPDEIVRLHERGRQVEDPEPGERLALLGCPVKCGKYVLFRLTAAASIWWKELACRWWHGSELWLTAALGYAMAHGRDLKPFPADRAQAFSEVRAWYRGLNVTHLELETAIAEVLRDASDDRVDEIRELCCRLLSITGASVPGLRHVLDPLINDALPPRGKPVDWEEITHELSILTGDTVDYWMHESREVTLRAWIRAQRRAAAMPGMGVIEPNTGADSQSSAIKALRQEIVFIIRAHAAEPAVAPVTPIS